MVLLGKEAGDDRQVPSGACCSRSCKWQHSTGIPPASFSAWSKTRLVSKLLKQENTEAGTFLACTISE